ncbi:MAG: DoxX family membrane protein [Paludibacteraceae bacterium]|nr:DoxX family membrane protein [Paludibacteraceae bacterium]
MDIRKIILIISRILVGGVFTFSGFVKIIDPWGTAYKIQDYLMAMGEPMTIFMSWAFIASVILAATELTVGLGLLLGIRLRENTLVAALMMLFMTPLTLWIALRNPVHDCGCFGDALIIDNWTTFWKNVVLCLLILCIWLLRKSHGRLAGTYAEWLVEGFSFFFAIAIAGYCYRSLPLIDFRPYHVGANIKEGMAVPEGAPTDSTVTTLIYRNLQDSTLGEFTLDNYPKDSLWEFVDQKTIVVREGYVPPVHDFALEAQDGDITDEVLEDEGYTFLVVSYDLADANLSSRNHERLKRLYEYARKNNYRFYVMTASVDQDIAAFLDNAGIDYPIVLTDKITLKTIIRYNPGVVLIKNATVYDKWSLPDVPDFKQPLEESKDGLMAKQDAWQKVTICSLLWLLPVLLIIGVNRRLIRARD